MDQLDLSVSVRKALIVGIDHYDHIGSLQGCVNDALAVKRMLDRHENGSVNFGQPRLMVATAPGEGVGRHQLKEAVRELFGDDSDVALFYFAGHGYIETTGGYLCASDSWNGDDGLPLAEVLGIANGSRARNKVILLDSCHSGKMGDAPFRQVTEITEGVTILTASTQDQYAMEQDGGGMFTGLLLSALGGAAADLMGHVTPGAAYAHIDQSLGNWSQRPVFKTNVKRFVSLRNVNPPLPLKELRRISEFFPEPAFDYKLAPSYEPTHPEADPLHTPIFGILQRYNRVNLLVPVGAPHMYDAAVQGRSARLTTLGEHYRRLVAKDLI